jgi:predicted permease
MNITIIFGQMLVLLAMMMIGYFIYRKKWISDDGASSLSRMVVNIFNPLLVIGGVLGDTSQISFQNLLTNLELILLYFVVLVLFSFVLLLVLRPRRELRSIYLLMATFSNLGFMGIPVARSLYGDEAVVYVSFYILVYNLLVYTYGMALTRRAAREKNGTPAEKLSLTDSLHRMMNPGVAGSLIAIVILASGLTFPSCVVTFCDYMGNTTIPLSMIMIGFSIAKADLKTYLKDVRIYAFTVLRMIVLPILFVFLMKPFALDTTVLGVFILELSMPVGSIIGLMAQENHADADYCMKGTVLTTLASILTIPLVGIFL